MLSTNIIDNIIDRCGFWDAKFPNATTTFISNKNQDSLYLIQKGKGNNPSVQIRLSNHGTYLKTWTDREELGNSVDRIDPSHSVNISIVFVDEGNDITNDCEGQPNCEGCKLPVCMPQKFEGQNELGRPFKVYQFVYQSKDIPKRYINALAKAIFHARYTGQYIDPLKDLPRAAKPKEFISTDLPQNKQPRYRQTENKEYKTKRTIRLTESKLRNIVREAVVDILSETDFKQVDNLGDYISQNGLQMRPASKFQRVNAQSGKSYINQYGKGQGMDKRQIGRMVRKGGVPLNTVAGDGTQETNNIVTRNHTVLNNVGNANNRWAAETPTFNRKYEQDPSAQGVYKPKGGPMNAAQINEPISFTAPWGEKMNIDKGGYILQDPNNPNDAYGISGKDFDSTYRFNEGRNNRLISKNMKQTIRLTESELHNIIRNCVSEAMNEGLFGTPLFGNDKKYGEKWYDPNTWLTKQQKNQQDEYEKKWAPIRKERERQRQQVEKEREEKRQAERRQKEWREHQYDKYGGYEGYLAYCKAEYEKRHPYACHAGETYSGIGHSAYDNMGR